MKVTDNFSRNEFLQEGRTISPIQEFMLDNLCSNILEPLRFFLDCKIKIVDGIRFPKDSNILRKDGYNPSQTSDHFFGNFVRIRSMDKKLKYGEYFAYSVGAADISPVIGAKKSWEMIKPFFNSRESKIELPNQTIKIGQCILEKRNSYIIHISNPPTLLFNSSFTNKFLKKTPFLLSVDNGKTYQTIN